jgi:hypothetical protein
MNILDENVPDAQRDLLRSMRVSVRQIGIDVGRKGMGDEDIIPLLRRLDALVYLDIERELVARFVRRLLNHPQFNTKVKRMGYVIRVSPSGLKVWGIRTDRESHVS